MAYLQQALAETLIDSGFEWHTSWDGAAIWQLSSLSIEYRRPALFADELEVRTWLEQSDPLRPVFGFEIQSRKSTGAPADAAQPFVRALGAWQQVGREDGQPVALPDELLARLPVEKGGLPRRFDLPADQPQARHFTWRGQVGVHEIGPDQRLLALAAYNWFEEALFDACSQAGWPLERRLQADMLILQTRHDTVFYEYPRLAEPVEITSRVVDFQRLRGSWMLDLRRSSDGALLSRDISTGVFLNLEGRPAEPSQAMLRDLLGTPENEGSIN